MSQEINFSNSQEFLETTIADIQECSGGILIRTHQSHLRARFGGQLEDGGDIHLNVWTRIAEVVLVNKLPYFFLPALKSHHVEVGASILLRLDLLRRQRISAMHTAIHLLCALTEYEMAVGYAGVFKSRVDFLGEAEDFNFRLNSVKARFNECVHANVGVNAIYLDTAAAVQLGGVRELRVDKNNQALRVIKIDGVDIRACNGTHVDRTGLLSGVVFGPAEKVGQGKFKVNLLLSGDTLPNLV